MRLQTIDITKRISHLCAWPLILLVRGYRLFLSPVVGHYCRFSPTCSVYALEALQYYGVWRGSWLTVRRLLRCHPWGGSGYDPIPCCQYKKEDQIKSPKPE